MAARFLLSLDCEGRWGVADCLGRRERALLTDERLQSAYRSILSLLDEYSLGATFAFVGLFGETAESFRQLRADVEILAAKQPAYLATALRDIDESRGEGWHGNWAVEEVALARAGHEIALHGITHVPWGQVDREFAIAELALHPLLTSEVRSARTFIAPRNEVAHTDLLTSIAIEGYRAAPENRSRIWSLLSELNIWERPQQDYPASAAAPLPIPSGYFLNWQHGLRRSIPKSVSRRRLERMLTTAAERCGIVHFWLHPENIATEPSTLHLLRDMVEIVSQPRDTGASEVLTQIDYVRSLSRTKAL